MQVLVGENGIISRAIEAKKKTEKTNELELVQLAYMTAKANNLGTKVTDKDMLEQLVINKVDVKTVYGNYELIVIMNNQNIYEIDENGNIEFCGTEIVYTEEEPGMMSRNDNYAFWQEEYRNKITKIENKPYIVKLENIEAEWDISAKKNKSVMAYLINEGNNEHTLYIMSNGEMLTLNGGQGLFRGFSSVKSIYLKNIQAQDLRMSESFRGCENVEKITLKNIVGVKGLHYTFQGCSKLETIIFDKVETYNLTDMAYCFSGCQNLRTLDLSNVDVSNVTNMRGLFYYCINLEMLNLNNWDTNSLEDVSHMFERCYKLVTTIDIKSNITNYEYIFANALSDSNSKVILNYTTESENSVDEIVELHPRAVKGTLIQ